MMSLQFLSSNRFPSNFKENAVKSGIHKFNNITLNRIYNLYKMREIILRRKYYFHMCMDLLSLKCNEMQ